MGYVATYKDLIVWQKSIDLVVEIYNITEQFPRSEQYGLISQLRRAAVSISSNIAEGRRRASKAEFKRFLQIAFGSGAEVETQLEIAKRLPITNELNYLKIEGLLEEVMKMLNKIICGFAKDLQATFLLSYKLTLWPKSNLTLKHSLKSK